MSGATFQALIAAAASGGNDQFTKIMHHFDDGNGATTFADTNKGGSAKTWTRSGVGVVCANTLATPKFGVSCLYQHPGGGTTNNIFTPDTTDFNLGSQDFTVDFWIDRRGDTGNRGVFGQAASDLTTARTISMLDSGGRFYFNIYASALGQIYTNTPIASSGWNHIEFARAGSTMYAFINGNLDATAAVSGTVGACSTPWRIYASGDWSAFWAGFQGAMDEFRLSVGIARHTSSFTPPTAPYTPP
jgi:hypothetical protein